MIDAIHSVPVSLLTRVLSWGALLSAGYLLFPILARTDRHWLAHLHQHAVVDDEPPVHPGLPPALRSLTCLGLCLLLFGFALRPLTSQLHAREIGEVRRGVMEILVREYGLRPLAEEDLLSRLTQQRTRVTPTLLGKALRSLHQRELIEESSASSLSTKGAFQGQWVATTQGFIATVGPAGFRKVFARRLLSLVDRATKEHTRLQDLQADVDAALKRVERSYVLKTVPWLCDTSRDMDEALAAVRHYRQGGALVDEELPDEEWLLELCSPLGALLDGEETIDG